ncbi:long-chain-fatty-acid--CoA ligase 1 [Trichonephila clavipes]|nr:long-chain-fatty-acid--CoA ligase 1 [Trichonephila clavipes]
MTSHNKDKHVFTIEFKTNIKLNLLAVLFVCIKGTNVFKGYFNNEKATQESIIDGWQHTGDIGMWLPNGSLKIIDRKKHLFKLSQGEYIAPEKIESVYSDSQLVLQILVEGNPDQNYIVALVVPEPENLKSWLKTKGYKDSEDFTQLLSNKLSRSAPYSSTVGPFSCRPSRERSCGRPCEGGYLQSCGSGRPHGPYID